jgi:Sperm-tail PG-rich repeat
MEDEPKPKTVQLTSVVIANALDSPVAHTSFGKLPLSDEKSAPIFSFGNGTRDKISKQYLGELNMPPSIGPGPKYEVDSQMKFDSAPGYSFGNDPRITLGKPLSYDHYEIQDTFTDPIKSKIYTKKNYGNTKFGTESRIPPSDVQGTPGPQYYPPIKLEVPTAPKFTLGARRNNQGGGLENKVSTPALIGPGRYVPEASSYTSAHRNPPKWTFGGSEKIGKMPKPVTKNQTYDTKSVACGTQIVSTKKTQPNVKIGTATREQVGKLGTFKDMMAHNPPKIHLPHPAF